MGSSLRVGLEGFSLELKRNDVDNGQTWLLVGLFEERMPLWNLTGRD